MVNRIGDRSSWLALFFVICIIFGGIAVSAYHNSYGMRSNATNKEHNLMHIEIQGEYYTDSLSDGVSVVSSTNADCTVRNKKGSDSGSCDQKAVQFDTLLDYATWQFDDDDSFQTYNDDITAGMWSIIIVYKMDVNNEWYNVDINVDGIEYRNVNLANNQQGWVVQKVSYDDSNDNMDEVQFHMRMYTDYETDWHYVTITVTGFTGPNKLYIDEIYLIS